MTEEKDMEEKPDLLDILLDNDNRDPIVLIDENGEKTEFEQVGVIPYGKTSDDIELYALLKPITKIENVGDNELIIFRIISNDDEDTVLEIEGDEETARAVYDKYTVAFTKKFRGSGQDE